MNRTDPFRYVVPDLQEDPFKLIHLGKDFRSARITSGNFLINDARVAFVAGDESGVLRVFEYDPSSESQPLRATRDIKADAVLADIASQAGQKLLCRTEYNAGVEALATLLFARRTGSEDPKQNGILYGQSPGRLHLQAKSRYWAL